MGTGGFSAVGVRIPSPEIHLPIVEKNRCAHRMGHDAGELVLCPSSNRQMKRRKSVVFPATFVKNTHCDRLRPTVSHK